VDIAESEDLVARLLDMANKRFSEYDSATEAPREKVGQLLAKLKRNLVADLHLTQAARPITVDTKPTVTPVSFVPFDIQIVAKSLGLSTPELRRLLSSGQSVADIAEEKGVSLDQVVEALIEPIEQQIRELLKNNRADEKEAKQKLESARQSFLKALGTFYMLKQTKESATVRPVQPSAASLVSAVPFNVRIVARTLGIDVSELRKQMAQGDTVAEIAKRMGVPLEEVVKALLAPVLKELREVVNSGRINEEAAKGKLEKAREAIIRALEDFVASKGDTSRSTEALPSNAASTTKDDVS